jgi:hypothetical protein
MGMVRRPLLRHLVLVVRAIGRRNAAVGVRLATTSLQRAERDASGVQTQDGPGDAEQMTTKRRHMHQERIVSQTRTLGEVAFNHSSPTDALFS